MKRLIFLIFLMNQNILASIDDANTPEVFQREYIYTNSELRENIQTVGVNTCVALVVLDDYGNGALAHFDAATNISSGLIEILSNFSDQSTLRVSLYGGQSPYKLERLLRDNLQQLGIVKVESIRNRSTSDSMNININLKTGKISQYDEFYSSSSYSERKFKLDRMKFSKRLYRHEDSIGGGDSVPDFRDEENNIFDFGF